MSLVKQLLQLYARRTEPPPGAEERVRALVQRDTEISRTLLRSLPEPDAWAETRVRSRVQAAFATPRPALRPALTRAGLGAAVALAITLGWLSWPRPAPPIAVAIDTVSADYRLGPDVALHAEGRGHAGGTERAPLVEWEEGLLSVEVTPGAGIDLVVRTPEATVRVIGTGFTVERSALGTSVSVRHGEVQVDCVVGSQHRLGAEASVECAPTRPAGLLARARAQAARGDAPQVVLATLDSASQPGTPAAILGEILALRIEVLRGSGAKEEALQAAMEYLERGYAPRRAEVRHIAAALLLERGGCRAALPLLREAVAEADEPEDRAALSACTGP